MDTCDAGRIGQKTTQLSENLYCTGNPFLVGFHVFENSDPSREVFVVFGSVTTVNEGSTQFRLPPSPFHQFPPTLDTPEERKPPHL